MKGNKKQPKGKNARSNQKNHTSNQPSGSKVNKHLNDRSATSAEKGGENEAQGEPAPGYGTVAPGIQGGGTTA